MEKFLEIINSNKEYFRYPKYLTKLLINAETPIYYLDELKKITEIYIKGDNEYNQKQIIDYSCLNQFENLVSLIISDNPNIEVLDVTNLKQLETLILFNNQYLKKVIGLDNLTKLKKVIIVGNNIKNINNISTIIKNNQKAKMLKFDINMFHYFDKLDIMNMENTNVSFAEKVSVGQLYNLTLDEMKTLYNKGLSIVKEMPNEFYNGLRYIYSYIVKTTSYDYEMLDKRNAYILAGNKIEIFDNSYKECNSSYSAIMNNMAVCEGYANALRFLANIKGYDIFNITCFLKKNNVDFTYYNHTASRINLGDEWFYLDSQIETNVNNIKYFLLTEEEFERTHKLLSYDTKRSGENNDTVTRTKYKK